MNFKNFFILFILCCLSNALFAEKKSTRSAFPSWMDEVNFESKNKSANLAEPFLPIDPSTNKVASETPRKFRPSLPDFSKMRAKASKCKPNQQQKQISRLEDSYSACLNGVQLLQKRRKQYEVLLSLSKDEQEKAAIKKEADMLNEKINLSNEFISLFKTGETKKAASELDPKEFNRAIEIQNKLFGTSLLPSLSPSLCPQAPTNALNIELNRKNLSRETVDSARMRFKRYKPGQIGSIYKELLKQRQKTQNKYGT